jgi:hypothetical protein
MFEITPEKHRMNKTLKLEQPLMAHGETKNELEFREPTGRDVSACGTPFRFRDRGDGETETIIETQSVAKYIVALANIPPNSVDKMSVRDFLAATNLIIGFFGAVKEATT